MLLLWKHGPLQRDEPTEGRRPIVQLICAFAAPPWPTQPLRKLSLQLIGTYTGINASYYSAKEKWTLSQSSSGNFKWTDAQVGLVINNRYELRQQIGHGAFGVVVRALDRQVHTYMLG